jgi:hypothetical protein
MASAEVSEESVYLCTGSPLPTDIEAVAQALFNEDFVDVYARVGDMQVAKGLALVDIVQQLLPCAPPAADTSAMYISHSAPNRCLCLS